MFLTTATARVKKSAIESWREKKRLSKTTRQKNTNLSRFPYIPNFPKHISRIVDSKHLLYSSGFHSVKAIPRIESPWWPSVPTEAASVFVKAGAGSIAHSGRSAHLHLGGRCQSRFTQPACERERRRPGQSFSATPVLQPQSVSSPLPTRGGSKCTVIVPSGISALHLSIHSENRTASLHW